MSVSSVATLSPTVFSATVSSTVRPSGCCGWRPPRRRWCGNGIGPTPAVDRYALATRVYDRDCTICWQRCPSCCGVCAGWVVTEMCATVSYCMLLDGLVKCHLLHLPVIRIDMIWFGRMRSVWENLEMGRMRRLSLEWENNITNVISTWILGWNNSQFV